MRCLACAALLFAGLATLHFASGALQSAALTGTSPVLLWSSLPGIVERSEADGSRTSYEKLSISAVATGLLSSLAGGEPTSHKSSLINNAQLQTSTPQLLVVFAGPELSLAQLAEGGEDLSYLQGALKNSAASLALPYVSHDAQDLASSLESVLEGLHLSRPIHRLGTCGNGPAAELSLPDVPAGKHAPQAVLVCGPERDRAASMSLLKDVFRLVEQSGQSYAFLFAGRPQTAQALGQHDRALMSEPASRSLLQFPAGSICNAKCRSQVAIFEGIILAVTLLSSLTVGLCCMHLVGTPTKFETPKESARQE